MLWSILIAGIPERYHSVQPLLYSLLETQAVARRPDVELLYLLDNRRRLVGAKRNDLLHAARGEFVSFIDDDDEVAANYVDKVLAGIAQARRESADVVCFPQRATLSPAGITHECTYSIKYLERPLDQRRQLTPTDRSSTQGTLNWSGPPAHTMIWRRELVKDIPFEDKQFGEDVLWCDMAASRAKREIQIPGDPLYFYKFDAERSTTR